MEISVVIPAYNASCFLTETLDSVLSQSYQDFEIVLVDDGSTDSTDVLIKGYQNAHEEKIRYVYQDNGGVAVARNTGINHSKGKFIAFCDADDLWSLHHLKVLYDTITRDSSLGLVHSKTTKIDEGGTVIDSSNSDDTLLSGNIFRALFLREANIVTSSVIFHKKCFDLIGPFDQQLSYLGCEDRDFWLRLTQRYPVQYVDSVLTYYRIRKDSLSSEQTKMHQARLYIIDKYTGGSKGNLRFKNHALARVYRESGDQALMKQDFDNAKRNYKQALKYRICNYWTWVNLIKAFLRVPVKLIH